MRSHKVIALSLLLSVVFPVFSESVFDEAAPPPVLLPYQSNPSGFEFMGNVWGDLKTFVVQIDPKKNYKPLWGLALSTALLIKYDQEILDESQRFARRIGLISATVNGRESHLVADLSFLGFDLPIRTPLNLNGAMYFIGDGLTHIAIAGGLATYGSIYDDRRAVNTASQVMESITVTGAVVQILKRATGRESPFRATVAAGKWDFFPTQKEYIANVSKYDAFPSGHLATAMATTIVVARNYPELGWIKPLGYTLIGVLSFAMLNNSVHWASDYPLGVAIGYLAADIAFTRGQARHAAAKGNGTHSIFKGYFFPVVLSNDRYSFNYVSYF